jgi:hypothetical protein
MPWIEVCRSRITQCVSWLGIEGEFYFMILQQIFRRHFHIPNDISIIGNILPLLPYKGALCIFRKFSIPWNMLIFIMRKSGNKLNCKFESIDGLIYHDVIILCSLVSLFYFGIRYFSLFNGAPLLVTNPMGLVA